MLTAHLWDAVHIHGAAQGLPRIVKSCAQRARRTLIAPAQVRESPGALRGGCQARLSHVILATLAQNAARTLSAPMSSLSVVTKYLAAKTSTYITQTAE